MSFAGALGHIMMLELGFNQTINIATPLMGLYKIRHSGLEI